jgi:nicotinamide N-methyltransferase
LILADLIFNRSEHHKLLWTCQQCLAPTGTAWVCFSHHDPEKKALDMKFFEFAPQYGLYPELIKQRQMRDLFEENDGLDHERDQVFVYALRFAA